MAARAQGGTALSRERVTQAALALIDSEGLDGLSMRRLAGELGVGTMTLYHYFASKRELLDAVLDAGLAGYAPPRPRRGPWRAQVRALARAGRVALSEHPGLAHIRAGTPILRPEALQFGETGLAILEDAGFEKDEAVKAYRLVFTYVFGFALVSPAAAEEENKAAAREALEALPPEYYPRLSAANEEASQAMAGDVVFDYGLERLLDWLEARRRASGLG